MTKCTILFTGVTNGLYTVGDIVQARPETGRHVEQTLLLSQRHSIQLKGNLVRWSIHVTKSDVDTVIYLDVWRPVGYDAEGVLTAELITRNRWDVDKGPARKVDLTLDNQYVSVMSGDMVGMYAPETEIPYTPEACVSDDGRVYEGLVQTPFYPGMQSQFEMSYNEQSACGRYSLQAEIGEWSFIS